MSSRVFPLALVACLLVACIPPTTGWQQAPATPNPGWQQAPARTREHLDARDTNDPRGYTRDANYPAPRQYARTSDNARNSGGGTARNAGGNSNWRCTAEGKMSTSRGDGKWSYSKERVQKNGPTRDDANSKALESCDLLMTTSVAIATSKGLRHDSESCRITSCVQGR